MWYAQELLRIVPYQIYTRTVPDDLTGSMVEQAALDPASSQRLIEYEGLRHLGFRDIKNEKIRFVSLDPVSLNIANISRRRTKFPCRFIQP